MFCRKESMMKSLKAIFSIIITLLFVASCGKSDGVNAEKEYTLSGVISQDSASIDADILLIVDKHSELIQETLPVTNGKFEYTGQTNSGDELFIIDNKGRSVSLFAVGGAQIELSIDKDGVPTFSGQDSINQYITEISLAVDTLKEANRKEYFDSVCTKFKGSIISGLLIRNKMHVVNDSVLMRQCFGRIEEAVKPQWLVDAIEDQFDRSGRRLKKNWRLNPLPTFATDIDSISYDFNESRVNSMYLYFWADYSQVSVDSLQMLDQISKQYGLYQYEEKYDVEGKYPKRIDIMTFCLHADSAFWRKTIEGLPGTHILLNDGMNNSAMLAWRINKVPFNLIIDRYSNVQDSYRWGKDLRDALEKMPNNLSGRRHDSKNNKRRTTRH